MQVIGFMILFIVGEIMRKLVTLSVLAFALIGCKDGAFSKKADTEAPKAAATASADASALAALTPAQQEAVRALIRDTLVSNPTILLEAQQAYEAQQIRAQNENVAKSWDKIKSEEAQIAFGPANAKVTIIEYFDYKCGFCHTALPWLSALMQAHPEHRYVFKELPILTENSRVAAKAAMASHKQGKYRQFHTALMNARGDLNLDQIKQIASSVGIDVNKMTAEMAKPEYEQRLQKIQEQAQEVGITGTPGFVINGKLISGFSKEELDATIGAASGSPSTP